MICVSFKFVNVEIFVESPIIVHRREYPGTRPLKSIPTRSHQKGYFENTSIYYTHICNTCFAHMGKSSAHSAVERKPEK